MTTRPPPRSGIFMLVLLLGAVLPARAGTIRGTVRAAPPPGIDAQDSGGAYASRKWKFVERIDYAHLTDFVVYLDEPAGQTPPPVHAKEAVTTQKDASFVPHVLPIAAGTTVRWPNDDDVFHNVYAMSEAKTFNLGLYKSERVPEITFDKPGRVDVFCAIHSQMHCIILVLPTPYFAKADARGRFEIRDVPAGTYKLHAWHERLPAKVVEVTVPADGEVTLDLVLGVADLPKY
ncbi:MAG TPA: carboxypeptidase regulatory-like domain-containing protein [Opitutus sp.]|nr:carboxypeptidase regulatory-like domain-containing protein [Opitutus sp.]